MGRHDQWGVALSPGGSKSGVVYRASLVLGWACEWRVLGTSLLAAKLGFKVWWDQRPPLSRLYCSPDLYPVWKPALAKWPPQPAAPGGPEV